MPDPTTTNLQLAVPTHGSDVDTWDVPLNSNANILDSAFGSVTSKSLSNVGVTLTATEAQAATLRFSGTLTGNVIVNVGAIIKSWVIENLTTGNFAVTISGGSGNVVGVPQGRMVQVCWDGTNCKFVNLGCIGDYVDSAAASVPAWVTACTVPPLLLCDGSTFSAVTYPYLNTILGGTTLPDMRGRSRFALNGGTNRITTAGSGIDGDTRFSSGGAQNETIGQVNLPNVNFNVTIPSGQGSHAHNTSDGSNLWRAGLSDASGVDYTGGSTTQKTVSMANATLPQMTGTAASGGSGTALTTMPPAVIFGITMIWAA